MSGNSTCLGASNLRRLPVAPKQWILLFLAAMLIAVLMGCNSGNTSNIKNPPPPPPAGVTIAFQSAPPTSLAINATTQVTAVVSNDSSNSGVDWVLTCQTGGTTCGTVSPSHTASGSPTTYTPPSSLPGNTEIVNIEGFASADETENVLASINVTAFGNNLSGTYVLEAQGLENGTTYQIAAAIVLDGNGNVTSGQQTVNFSDPSTGSYTSSTAAITPSGSSYFLGPDGRGTLSLNTGNPSVGVETFSLVYLSNSQLLIAATPTNTLVVSASGTMDLQASTVTTPLTGGYAFVVSGTDFNGAGQSGIGGILNINNQVNNPNNISGTGSVADQNLAGSLNPNQPVNGSITVPSSLGVTTLTLNFPSFSTSPMTFTGYMVDANHIKLIESDQGGSGSVAGLALGQGSSTGTFSDTSFSGTYILGTLGFDLASGLPDTFTSVASFTADGAGHFLNGYTDTVFQALSNPSPQTPGGPTQISAAFIGNYSVAASGRMTSSFGSISIPNNLFRPLVYFYLGGDGTALILENSDLSLNYPLIAVGTADPQSTTLTFSGSYGLNFAQQSGSEFDSTGIMTVAMPSITGAADVGTNVDQGFTGTVSTQACSSVTVGCFSGSFVNNTGGSAFQGSNAANPNAIVAFTADFYLIDQNHGFFIENDLLQQSTPQVSLGYFVTAAAPQAPAAAAKSAKSKRK